VDRDHYSEVTVATAVRLLGKIPDLAAQLALVKALQSESPLIRYCTAGAVRGRAVSYRHMYELARNEGTGQVQEGKRTGLCEYKDEY